MLAGRVILTSKYGTTPVRVDLEQSVLAGEIDLKSLKLGELHLSENLFSGGRILTEAKQLKSPDDPLALWQIWRWLPADRCGILAR